MVVALPVESSSLLIQIISGIIMFAVAVYLGVTIFKNWSIIWHQYPQSLLIIFSYCFFSLSFLLF